MTCPNCNSTLDTDDKFCSNCGQKKLKEDLKIKHLLVNFFEDYFSFDNKILQTLKVLLFKPAKLSLDYIQGKRARYVPPIRLYFFVAFICLALVKILSHTFTDEGGHLDVEIGEGIDEGFQDEAEGRVIDKSLGKEIGTQLGKLLYTQAPLLLLFLLPVITFILYVLYYKKNRFYIESFIVGIHLQTFFFIALLFGNALEVLLDIDSVLVTFVLYFSYALVALKRYYKNNYFVTTIKLLAFI